MRWPRVVLIAGGAVLTLGFLAWPVTAAIGSVHKPVPVQAASLTVTITSLPSGTAADVTVTGPDRYFRYLPRSATLRGLRPGAYAVNAGPVKVASGLQYPVSQETSVRLQPGGSSVVQVSYADTIPDTTKVPARRASSACPAARPARRRSRCPASPAASPTEMSWRSA